MMKVLFINSKHLNAPGGAERFAKVTMDVLGDEHEYSEIFEIDDLKVKKNKDITSILIKNKRNDFLNRVDIIFSSLFTSSKKRKINRKINEYNPDVIIVNNGITSGCSYISKKNLKKRKVFIIQHTDINVTVGVGSFIKKTLFKLVTLKSKYVNWVAFSNKSLSESEKHFKFKQGHSLPLFSKKNHAKKTRPTDVIFVGRLSQEKNIPLLNEVFSKIPELKKVIIGRGEQAKYIDLKMENLKYYDFLENEKTVNEISKSKMLFSCSDFEGFSYVAVEAINNGVPIMIKDNFLEAETLSGKGKRGFCYKGNDPIEISNLIKSNINFFKEKEYVEHIKRFEEFSSQKCKEKIKKIFTT
ncbi:glycosyltransferase family 4 protein [Mycoplasma todarodis]|uniref:Glycosyl transferase family 1 domain-containing protein n=1 Tax=Mycoplasma todarodis TaxID=1937191 RepID=A0A4R0XTK9_9MOLU|nr:glycosyltransferase family 4 protein [Mycoplasma todarodis]TCG11834.1 hypothetical protein C4B25_00755 [Mycoplasma todarodis]